MQKKNVNIKLYSIKRLFYLCQAVKLQFFKSFIMPHFDYCSTFFSYFPKATLQKIYNTYNYTIYKLLNLKATSNANDFNSILEKYGLNNFQHRLLIRMATFVYNIVNPCRNLIWEIIYIWWEYLSWDILKKNPRNFN